MHTQHYLTAGLFALSAFQLPSVFPPSSLTLPFIHCMRLSLPLPAPSAASCYGRLRPVGSPETFSFFCCLLQPSPLNTHTLTSSPTSAHRQVSHDTVIDIGRVYLRSALEVSTEAVRGHISHNCQVKITTRTTDKRV